MSIKIQKSVKISTICILIWSLVLYHWANLDWNYQKFNFWPLCMSQNNVNSDLTVITNCNFTRICQTWFILTHPRRFQKPDKKCNSLRCMKIRMLLQKWITPKCTKRVLSVCNNTTVTQLVNFPKQYFKPCRYKKERRKKPFE